ACQVGCSEEKACAEGQTCCDSQCFDLTVDVAHCGSCDNACVPAENADPACGDGLCEMGACLEGFADCNGDSSDGCEHDTTTDGPCVCTPGVEEACYTGAPGSDAFGPCKAGTHVCNADGLGWGPCVGE